MWYDNDTDGIHAIIFPALLQCFGCQLHSCHIAQSHDSGIIFADQQVAKLFFTGEAAQCFNGELGIVAIDLSGRKVDVFIVQSIPYIRERNIKSAHLCRIHPDAHRITFLSEYIHRTHLLDGLKLLLQHVLGIVAKFHQSLGAALHCKDQNEITVCIRLGNHRWCINILWEPPGGLAHFITYIADGTFKINAKFKFDSDLAIAQCTGRSDGFDPRDTIHLFL